MTTGKMKKVNATQNNGAKANQLLLKFECS